MSAHDLERRVGKLEKTLSAFSQELRLALRYVQPDAASSLTKSRLVLEKLLIGVFTAEMAHPPRKPLLGEMLADNQFTRKIERRIMSRMNAIRDMGNLGPHGEPVEPSDAAHVLDNLCEVLDWYLRRYVGSNAAVPEGQGNAPTDPPIRPLTPPIVYSTQTQPKPGSVFDLPIPLSELPGEAVTMKFAWIPPGEFRMGSDLYDREKPVHRVTLTKGIYLGVFPVTQCQWQAVMKDNPSHFRGDDRPVETVSWNNCQEFCQKMRRLTGKPIRLPTEAEWEYACRADSTSEYYNGDGEEALRKVGWYDGNSGGETRPVGKLAPNAWGLYDMHGNVWQWCEDWYGPYSEDDITDPKGANFGDGRVLRGGSWYYPPVHCRAAYRGRNAPAIRYAYCGCRVCFLLD